MDSSFDLTGRTIGRYQIRRRLGRGGMAEVYQAYQTSLERHVALKVILPFLTDDPDFLKRFEREAKSVAALRHPNIVQVFDYDVADGLPYMVMEFIEGDTLKGLLDKLSLRRQTLPLTQAVRVTREIAQALAYAHRQGVIHRDIKPGNVMLDKSGRVILTDFGVAKMLGSQTITASGAATGTPAYMSPEAALGRAVDHRADLYALGVILYELVTGQVPFDADTPLAVMLKHAHEVRPSPRRLRPDLPEALERVILKSMARDPDERFQNADDLIGYLNNPGAAAQISVPASATTAAPLEAAPTVVALPVAKLPRPAAEPGAAAAPDQDIARTRLRPLKEIACFHCTGAGLELERDGRVRCTFCSELNAMAGPVCPRCEFVNDAGAEVCADCRLALVRTCPECETRNWSGAEKCVACGRPLDALAHLMDRAGDAGDRYHRQRRELAAVASQEEAGGQSRLARLEAIDRRRHAALHAAAERKAREQRVILAVLGVIVVLLIVGFIVAALWMR